jgi:hypothetical protein
LAAPRWSPAFASRAASWPPAPRKHLDSADREPRLDNRYTHRAAGTERQKEFLTLAATGRREETEVRLQTLAENGEPWDDERIERLAHDLADIRVQLEPKRTRAAGPS